MKKIYISLNFSGISRLRVFLNRHLTTLQDLELNHKRVLSGTEINSYPHWPCPFKINDKTCTQKKKKGFIWRQSRGLLLTLPYAAHHTLLTALTVFKELRMRVYEITVYYFYFTRGFTWCTQRMSTLDLQRKEDTVASRIYPPRGIIKHQIYLLGYQKHILGLHQGR